MHRIAQQGEAMAKEWQSKDSFARSEKFAVILPQRQVAVRGFKLATRRAPRAWMLCK